MTDQKSLLQNSSKQNSISARKKIYIKIKALSMLDYILILIVVLSVAIGAYVRINGLDNWSVAGDEYFIAKSVESILDNGLPSFPTGGYYTRGILYQYLSAFLILLGINLIYAIRIIPAVSNILAIPAIYILTKKTGGKIIAAAIVFLFCFSLWEAEFARFARMYSPFQTIFVWYLLAFYKYIIEEDKSSEKWLYILSFVSIFVFEGSIFLAALNFIPFFIRKKISKKEFLISLGILLFTILFLTFDFRRFLSNTNLPAVFSNSEGTFRIPVILAVRMFNQSIFYKAGFIVIAGSYLFCLFKIYFNSKNSAYFKFSLAIVISAILVNQFGLAILLLISFVLLDWISKQELFGKNNIIFIAFIILVSIFYYSFFISSDFLQIHFPDFQLNSIADKIKRGTVLLFDYPLNYSTLWMYYEIMPFFTIISVSIIFFGLLHYLVFEDKKNIKLIFFVFIGTMLLVLLINTPIKASRYSFFLFPLYILIFLLSLHKLISIFIKSRNIKNILFTLLLIIFLFVSEDFNLNHLFNISKKEYNFRLSIDKNISEHFYSRWDFQTPADFINTHSKKGDIIISSHVTADYYLPSLTHIYMDAETNQFASEQAAGNGNRELWSNAKFIHNNDDLFRMINNSDKDVWFLAVSQSVGLEGLNSISFYQKYKKNLIYTSIDSNLTVYYFPHKESK